jgi:hypothetical protein
VKILTFINLLILILFSLPYSGITSDYISTAQTSNSPSFKINKFLTASDFNDADIPFIASHFNIIDTYLSKGSQIQKIKGLNPLFKAIYYKDSLTHREGATENWYVRDAKTGSRLVNKDWGWYLMDIGNQTYRISLANSIKNSLASNQVFDGVFFDDVWGSVASDRFYREGTKENGIIPQSIINSWRDNMKLLLGEIKTEIGNKLLIINTGAFNTDYLALSDGQMFEAFCHANWQPYGEYYSNWSQVLDKMIEGSKLGKIYLAQSGIKDGATDTQIKITQRYCFAMFMLGANTNANFYFKPSMKYQGVTYFPEWDIDIGSPMEDYHARSGTPLYEREYSKGLVLINPSSENVQIKLDDKYKNLNGVTTHTITLASHEGEVLLKISGDTTPPAPPKGVKILK